MITVADMIEVQTNFLKEVEEIGGIIPLTSPLQKVRDTINDRAGEIIDRYHAVLLSREPATVIYEDVSLSVVPPYQAGYKEVWFTGTVVSGPVEIESIGMWSSTYRHVGGKRTIFNNKRPVWENTDCATGTGAYKTQKPANLAAKIAAGGFRGITWNVDEWKEIAQVLGE